MRFILPTHFLGAASDQFLRPRSRLRDADKTRSAKKTGRLFDALHKLGRNLELLEPQPSWLTPAAEVEAVAASVVAVSVAAAFGAVDLVAVVFGVVDPVVDSGDSDLQAL